MAPMTKTRAINMLIFFTMMLLLNFIVLMLYFFLLRQRVTCPKRNAADKAFRRFGNLMSTCLNNACGCDGERSTPAPGASFHYANQSYALSFFLRRRYRTRRLILQRPSMLECGRCEARSAPSLCCWYVRNRDLNHTVIAPSCL